MKQFFLTAILALTAGPIPAETFLYTESPCLPSTDALKKFAVTYEEEPLFSGTGFAMVLTPYSEESIPVTGPVFFTVNQTTGTWTLFFAPDPETLCLLSSGTAFEPE